jgi:hypothetical protein
LTSYKIEEEPAGHVCEKPKRTRRAKPHTKPGDGVTAAEREDLALHPAQLGLPVGKMHRDMDLVGAGVDQSLEFSDHLEMQDQQAATATANTHAYLPPP